MLNEFYNVVYRALATGTRSRGVVHRQSIWLAGMARHWAAGLQLS